MKQGLQGVEILLLDIEGTICPITFVKDTLFPYALKVLPEVLTSDWNSPEFASYRAAFPDEAQKSPDAFLAHVQDLTQRDVKVAYLKDLQGELNDSLSPCRLSIMPASPSTIIMDKLTTLGYLWESGYKSSAYATPLFSDVVPALKSFESSKKRIAIYSSGSIFAQKLLFAHVQSSSSKDSHDIVDLTSLIENPEHVGESWFDTTNAGPKNDVHSYETIARKMGADSTKILFLSDNVKEVAAALSAGMKSVVVDRPGNAPLTASDREEFDIVDSFKEIQLR